MGQTKITKQGIFEDDPSEASFLVNPFTPTFLIRNSRRGGEVLSAAYISQESNGDRGRIWSRQQSDYSCPSTLLQHLWQWQWTKDLAIYTE